MKLTVRRVNRPYASVFRIAYSAQTHAPAVVAEIADSKLLGRGEALGVFYRGETIESMVDELSDMKGAVANGISCADLQTLLPACGARNALDCALWDLESKRSRQRAWQLAGLNEVRPLATDYTVGLDTPGVMARTAKAAGAYSLLKLKLNGVDDWDRVVAVREARPDAQLIVDANQAWTVELLCELAPRFADLGVILIEQPLPAGNDGALCAVNSPIPLCADESCQTSESLAAVRDKYQYINIKLDKTGGLTEALRLAHLARISGLKLMVGCMGGSSLSMAPAFVIGQLCELADLDGPLLLTSDVPHGLRYESGRVHPPDERLWG